MVILLILLRKAEQHQGMQEEDWHYHFMRNQMLVIMVEAKKNIYECVSH